MKEITISINGEIQEIEEDCSLQQLLQIIGRTDTRGIAVARNNDVIPRDLWTTTSMEHNDKIMIVHATQGG